MEEQMNYILMPSLQLRALIRTATTLWNQDDVRAFTAELNFKSKYFSGKRREWQVVEDKVIEKVQMLPLPESLKKEVSYFIKPIFLEVLRWLDYHEVYLSDKTFVKESLNKICWTPQGTVDRKKTAEAIIRVKNVDIKKRYEIACMSCLKNDILMLWNKMPEDYRKHFYSEKYMSDVKQNLLVVLWTRNVKGEVNWSGNVYDGWRWRNSTEYAFEAAATYGNKAATEYFLQKLTSEDRGKCLVRSAELFCYTTDAWSCHSTDVLCFLLSLMNEEQQVKVLRNHSFQVLICLLDWPWQGFFMEMAKRVWTFLHEDDFYNLLKLIIKKVKDGFKDYNYQYLFRDFWQQSPITHKERITNIPLNTYLDMQAKANIFTKAFLLLDLLELKDKKNMKLILEDLRTLDREKIIFASYGINTCARLVCNDEMDLLEFLVQECLSTKDILTKFREKFEKHIIQSRVKEMLEEEKDMWSKAFQLLDDLTQKFDNKRCVEDGNNSPSKRLCSVTSE